MKTEMKKEYETPLIEVIDGRMQSMICLSLEAEPGKSTPTMDSMEDVEFKED